MTNTDPVADLEAWAAGLEQRARQFDELGTRLGATTATESSPGGVVRVTVDANGVPTDVYLAESARGMDPAQLSTELMTTMRKAQTKLSRQVQELVGDTVPGGDEAADELVSQYRRRFPDQVVRRDFGEDVDYGVLDD